VKPIGVEIGHQHRGGLKIGLGERLKPQLPQQMLVQALAAAEHPFEKAPLGVFFVKRHPRRTVTVARGGVELVERHHAAVTQGFQRRIFFQLFFDALLEFGEGERQQIDGLDELEGHALPLLLPHHRSLKLHLAPPVTSKSSARTGPKQLTSRNALPGKSVAPARRPGSRRGCLG